MASQPPKRGENGHGNGRGPGNTNGPDGNVHLRRAPAESPRKKITWTDAEKTQIAETAARLQREDPSLAGLALLRAALRAMPPERRRKVIAISQASWFDPAVRRERDRQDAREAAQAAIAPVLQEQKSLLASLNALQKDWQGMHQEWYERHAHWVKEEAKWQTSVNDEHQQNLDALSEAVGLLKEIRDLLKRSA